MDSTAYARMQSGTNSWWYRGRSRIVRDALSYSGFTKADEALDFGAGYGAMFPLFATLASRVSAFEPERDPAAIASKKAYTSVFTDERESLSHTYDLIGLLDVLEHIEHDAAQLERLYGALRDDGRLVVTVPAGMLLWSTHDVQNMHFRRYSRATLVRVLEHAGFHVQFVSYWNTILYPLALAARTTGNSGESSFALPSLIDSLFYGCISIESHFMRWIKLPFGVSLVAVAIKRRV